MANTADNNAKSRNITVIINGKNDVRKVEKNCTITAITKLHMLITLRHVTFLLMNDFPLLMFIVSSHAIASEMNVGTPIEYSIDIITLCVLGETYTAVLSI